MINSMMDELPFLPPEIHGPSAWVGPALLQQTDWLYQLSESEIIEIGAAVNGLANASGNLGTISADDFPLPTFAPRLQSLLGEVLEGRGFVLLRRLPVERWSHRQSAIAFLGIGSHLGRLRAQNAEGHLLGHVKDQGRSSQDPNVRIYQTRERQTFHTDSCDVVGLLCLATARSGGLSSLVSSTTIFNEMRRRRPDLARVLFAPIETDRRGEVEEGEKPYFRIPIFNWHAGLLSTIYQRQYVESARRFPDVRPLTPAQIAGLDLLDELANDPQLHLTMELQPGDMQFVHNHTVLHDRTAYEDWPEAARKRHLLRLWLAPPAARPLPGVFAERFGSVVPGDRGGVISRSSRPVVVLCTDDMN
jgi:hypothetical protein